MNLCMLMNGRSCFPEHVESPRQERQRSTSCSEYVQRLNDMECAEKLPHLLQFLHIYREPNCIIQACGKTRGFGFGRLLFVSCMCFAKFDILLYMRGLQSGI